MRHLRITAHSDNPETERIIRDAAAVIAGRLTGPGQHQTEVVVEDDVDGDDTWPLYLAGWIT